jgi:hypothetical protein
MIINTVKLLWKKLFPRKLAFIVICVLCFAMVLFLINLLSDKPPIIVLINNTNHNLTIFSVDGSIHVASGNVTEIPFPYSSWIIRIQIDTRAISEYKWNPLGRPYYNRSRYYLQIEENGDIYVLPFRVDGPVKKLPSQPVGIPLRPRNEMEKTAMLESGRLTESKVPTGY